MPKSSDKPATPARRRPPAATPEVAERRLILKAQRLAERQMDEGIASSQVITHYLKLGSSRERVEQERIQMEIELGEAKRSALESVARAEELQEEAIRAFTDYRPTQNYEIPPEELRRVRR